MDLSKYISEPAVYGEIQHIIDKIYENNVVKREQSVQSRFDRVQHDLVRDAVQRQQELVANTKYRKKLTDLLERGLSYSEALDSEPGINIVAENTETLGEKAVFAPKVVEEKKEKVVEQITPQPPEKPKRKSIFKRATDKIDMFFLKRKKGDSSIDYE